MARLVKQPEEDVIQDQAFYTAFGIENPQLKSVNKVEVDPIIQTEDFDNNTDSDNTEMDSSSFEEQEFNFIDDDLNENEATIMDELYNAGPILVDEPIEPDIDNIIIEEPVIVNNTIDDSLESAIQEFNRVSEECYPLHNNINSNSEQQEIIENEVITEDNNSSSSTNTVTYPKTSFITKDHFVKFISALNIIKNLKQNVIFENGVSHFISDNQTFIYKFDINCPEISFQFPFANQQASQLNFLTKSGDSITVIETEDDYTFSNGTFKFKLRKSIPDLDPVNKTKFDNYHNSVTKLPKLAEYEFTDPVFLSQFLSIIKGVKRGFIELINDNQELVINRGDVNSGQFELLRIPINTKILNNETLDSQLDTLCLMYDYSKLKFTIYYDEKDFIYILFTGTIGEYDVTIITNSYINFNNRII